jgi:hypothetical protein
MTPTEMLQQGWHPTGLHQGIYEVWHKADKMCLYSRLDKKIVQIKKIKSSLT